ncbi:hypothetical protein H5410_019074 [Solanum commersonii]|uniref:Malectin-like domain-containing protein n=1 Tax=Solanum commersonii TaxID=4109 RepID=A0A9J6A4H7_SOLCO|nr:hypothetical protein H5410_019074 [Solanum commersonii]
MVVKTAGQAIGADDKPQRGPRIRQPNTSFAWDSVGATHWATIVIPDANTMEYQEFLRMSSDNFMVQYIFTEFENDFFMSVSARINFGAESDDPVRYPDDPFDRIWTSNTIKKVNCLVDVAAGTERVSTKISIDVNTVNGDMPSQKVM